jgi:hypothetical protein
LLSSTISATEQCLMTPARAGNFPALDGSISV